MDAKIRFFEHADAPAVLKLYQSSGQWFEDIGVNQDFIISSSQRPDFRFIVADGDGTISGFIGAQYFPLVKRAELGPIGVLEGRRGAGTGSALVKAMLGFLAENGIKRVHVKVKAANGVAISFFLSQGFSYEAYYRKYTLDGEDAAQLSIEI
jgi:ribosomal protein S18 acetylase RimI-like enzyme